MQSPPADDRALSFQVLAMEIAVQPLSVAGKPMVSALLAAQYARSAGEDTLGHPIFRGVPRGLGWNGDETHGPRLADNLGALPRVTLPGEVPNVRARARSIGRSAR
jgi:hypothetical protein